jgi:hypothetical protein
VGAEPDLPNYEEFAKHNPPIAQAMERDGVPRTRLGYNALANLGYKESNPPKDFGAALAEVNHAFIEYWAEEVADVGIPSAKLYTHIAAGAGVAGSPEVQTNNAPISIAFVEHARPGWTTYPVGPFRNGFTLLYDQLAEHGNPHWASTEASACWKRAALRWMTSRPTQVPSWHCLLKPSLQAKCRVL